MKSRCRFFSESELDAKIRKEAEEAARALQDEIHQKCEKDITHQALATCFWILHKDFGFGKSRLHRLKDSIEDEYKLMMDGVLGQEYNPHHCEEWLKQEMGIDLDESQYKEE